MALPVAHLAIAAGSTRSRDPWILCSLGLLSVLPDFDFFLVWVLGFPMKEFHRTFSHSLVFAAALTVLFALIRPRRLRAVSAGLFLFVLASHGLLDLMCTLDAADHGVMLLWPFSESRWGWAILVPLYQQFGDSPFSPAGALRFTVLEMLLAIPFWWVVRTLREWLRGQSAQGCPVPDQAET